MKQYKEAVTELNLLQEQSRARLKEEQDELIRVRDLHKTKKRPFHPAEFGFVSKPERIEMFFRRCDAKTDSILRKSNPGSDVESYLPLEIAFTVLKTQCMIESQTTATPCRR